jgi:hypothetical protein
VPHDDVEDVRRDDTQFFGQVERADEEDGRVRAHELAQREVPE